MSAAYGRLMSTVVRYRGLKGGRLLERILRVSEPAHVGESPSSPWEWLYAYNEPNPPMPARYMLALQRAHSAEPSETVTVTSPKSETTAMSKMVSMTQRRPIVPRRRPTSLPLSKLRSISEPWLLGASLSPMSLKKPSDDSYLSLAPIPCASIPL